MKYRPLIAFLVITTALLPVIASCEKEEITRPSYSVSSADWHTVPASGGTIEVNDITIEFPSGAFEKNGKVAVTPLKKGSVKAAKGRELSEFYQLVFPKEGVKQPMTISINYSGDPSSCYMIEVSPKMNRYTGVIDLHNSALRTKSSGGVSTAVISEVSESEDNTEPFFIVGLVTGNPLTDLSTKATQTFYYTIDWQIPSDSLKWYETYKPAIEEVLDSALDDILPAYAKLGFSFPTDPVPYVIVPLSGEKWGAHNSDKWKKKNSTVELHLHILLALVKKGKPYDKALLGQVQQTIIHETFHWLHEYWYDPRFSPVICKQGFNEWSMLSEAVATWIEQFTGDKKISKNCAENADNIVTDFFCSKADSFERTGYGMGFFIDWLAKRTSNKTILKILEYQRDNGGKFSSASLRAAFDKILKDNKLEFFEPADNWEALVFDILSTKIDSRINCDFGTANRLAVIREKVSSPSEAVYNYGVAVQNVVYPLPIKNKLTENPTLCLAFYQDADNLKTWVCDDKFVKLGAATKDKPFAVNGSVALANEKLRLVTERIKQDTKPNSIPCSVTSHIVPWPTYVEVEWGGIHGDNEYYSWSGDEIKVTYTLNGYFVECDFPSGSHMHFYIGWVNNRLTDVSSVYFWQEYNASNKVSVGKLKLNYSSPSSIEKDLSWSGKYKGDVFYLHCRLI